MRQGYLIENFVNDW